MMRMFQSSSAKNHEEHREQDEHLAGWNTGFSLRPYPRIAEAITTPDSVKLSRKVVKFFPFTTLHGSSLVHLQF